MVEHVSWGRRAFVVFNYTFLSLVSLACVLPLIHVLAISFSSSEAAAAGLVKLWPVGFTVKSYAYVAQQKAFLASFLVTLQRVAVGVTLNMLMTILIAYPLSKESSVFRPRTAYAWAFVVTILFNGGLIPTYMVVKYTGIMDTIWALVLPTAVPVFNVILMLNFFRNLPKEMEEAAFMDGAGQWRTLWNVYLPMSLPSLATVTLFATVAHWNSWFDGLIFMNRPEHYPLQSYMQTVIIQQDLSALAASDLDALSQVSTRTVKAAQIFLGALPVLLVYPFLQRFFISGIVLGSVKE
ncbi:carbohydrate ABC transporter permease [Paenibacillus sp.]|uniref:carbohydrate ABC transporter permease n=1 Tax=Paenibacillus sp. TaxID=58172 RepID=UPI002D490348|nr:carbohydrate ABC transporter permease [Paenibacillus sp.]HZG86279.1 carbohydrate ABC transporter permease [Paenibacillus sp.]